MPSNPVQSFNGSVVRSPESPGVGRLSDYIIYAATTADQIPAWGTSPRLRDRMLRDFWPTEPVLAGALYSTVSRYAGFEWTLDGPERMVNMYRRILHNSEHGRGWLSLINPVVTDYLSQDNGAFMEIIRTDDEPSAPVVQLNHLDSNQCHRTGVPEFPVIYYDRHGYGHLLKWYQVVMLTEMASPIEIQNGRQYCAVSRVLKGAQLARDVHQYKRERATGQDTKQIHVVTGVSTDKIDTAITDARSQSAAEGYARYTRAVVVGSYNPEARAQVATIDLAKLPEGYDEEKALRDYIIQIAMAFGCDYQDFAPLPTGSMGSGSQSEVLALKSRGKGPNLFMRSMEFVFNYHGIFPQNVTFSYGEQDSAQDLDNAKLRAMRAEERAMRIKSGELSPEVARLMARDAGDLEEQYLPLLESYEPAEVQIARTAAEAKVKAGEEDPSTGAQVGRARVKKQEGGLPATSVKTKELDPDPPTPPTLNLQPVVNIKQAGTIVQPATPPSVNVDVQPARVRVPVNVNVPSTPPPTVNTTVQAPPARRKTIERDSEGRIVAIVESDA